MLCWHDGWISLSSRHGPAESAVTCKDEFSVIWRVCGIRLWNGRNNLRMGAHGAVQGWNAW